MSKRAPHLRQRDDRGSRGHGIVRIVGGSWRGRRIEVPPQADLRPTPDRVRETLFNWLQPVIAGARCLDLFAGSGALGFEAVSRGAAQVVMLDTQSAVVASLRQQCVNLGAGDRVEVVAADALTWLAGAEQPFDIVFLDPPFRLGLLQDACAALEAGHWLKPSARVYIEASARHTAPTLPDNWSVHRAKRAGEVSYSLVIRAGQ